MSVSWGILTLRIYSTCHHYAALNRSHPKSAVTQEYPHHFCILLFPNLWGWTVYELPPLDFVPHHLSSLMFSTLISSSKTYLRVFFGLPAVLLPSTSKFIDRLTIWSSSLLTTWLNHLSLVHITTIKLSTPHLSTSSFGT